MEGRNVYMVMIAGEAMGKPPLVFSNKAKAVEEQENLGDKGISAYIEKVTVQ